MLFAVVQTHRKGVKLSRDEIRAATPVIGNLILSDWREGNAANRAIRVATLKHPKIEYYPALLQPIFDPVLVRMTSVGFLIVGMEYRPEGDETIETVQGWWVRFIDGQRDKIKEAAQCTPALPPARC